MFNKLFLRDIHTKSWYGHAGVLDDLILSGDRLNKKDGLTRYGNSHVKDKTS